MGRSAGVPSVKGGETAWASTPTRRAVSWRTHAEAGAAGGGPRRMAPGLLQAKPVDQAKKQAKAQGRSYRRIT